MSSCDKRRRYIGWNTANAVGKRLQESPHTCFCANRNECMSMRHKHDKLTPQQQFVLCEATRYGNMATPKPLLDPKYTPRASVQCAALLLLLLKGGRMKHLLSTITSNMQSAEQQRPRPFAHNHLSAIVGLTILPTLSRSNSSSSTCPEPRVLPSAPVCFYLGVLPSLQRSLAANSFASPAV